MTAGGDRGRPQVSLSPTELTMSRAFSDAGPESVLVASGKPLAIQFAITPEALATAINLME
jgi:hypothetical protein